MVGPHQRHQGSLPGPLRSPRGQQRSLSSHPPPPHSNKLGRRWPSETHWQQMDIPPFAAELGPAGGRAREGRGAAFHLDGICTTKSLQSAACNKHLNRRRRPFSTVPQCTRVTRGRLTLGIGSVEMCCCRNCLTASIWADCTALMMSAGLVRSKVGRYSCSG